LAEENSLKELLAVSCRIIGKLNMTKEPSGHVSARIPGSENIYIKARGRAESGLRFVTTRDFITVDMDGRKLDGLAELDVPQEVFIHTEVYRSRPEVQSVIHVHPLTVVLFTICDMPLLPLTGAYDPSALRLVTEGIPTYPRSVLISNAALGRDLSAAIGRQRACLMRGHGITAAGTSVQDATLTAIKLKSFTPTHERMKASGAYVESAWRYYCTLLDEPVISPSSDKSDRG
jgi:ribulose-5-phosphate 4-epimerase/fuculose-1-phosphate aldolase